MSVAKLFKKIALALGFYPQALKLSRLVRGELAESFQKDVALYTSLLPKGALCFDVGANIGTKSEAMLRSGAQVIAFEPNPLVLPELKANCSRFENFTLIEAALGSGAAIATLYIRKGIGQSSLKKNWEGKIVSSCNVPVVTLDAAIEKFGIPYYCKIDVEGWELEVLQGLSHAIPLISFEFHLNDKDIHKTKACIELLSQRGESEVNITPPEESTFLFVEWVPLDVFLRTFPGLLSSSLRGQYGDIFVRKLIR